MTKIFILHGLDCANCAAAMERKISALDGVDSVSVNFFTTKMTISGQEDKMPTITAEAEKIIKSLEPGVKVKHLRDI